MGTTINSTVFVPEADRDYHPRVEPKTQEVADTTRPHPPCERHRETDVMDLWVVLLVAIDTG